MIDIKKLIFGNHSNKQIVAKNAFWMGLVEVFSKLVMFFVTVSIVRYLGPSGFGDYTSAFSIVAILMIFSDFGMSSIMIRDISKDKKNATEYFSNVFIIKFFSSLLILVVLFIISLFAGQNLSYIKLIILVSVYNLILQLEGLTQSVLVAFERMEFQFISRIIYFTGILIAAVVSINLNFGVHIMLILFALVSFFALFVGLFLIKRQGVVLRFELNLKICKKILVESLPMFGYITCAQLYSNADTLLIKRYFSSDQVGFYQSAYKILFAIQSINIINSASFPRISALAHENNHTTFYKLIKHMVAIGLILLLPLGLIISFNSQEIIKLIYGVKYLSAAPVLVFLVWVGVLNYFRVMLINILISKNSQSLVFISVLIGLIVNVALNIFLLPKFGITFASINLLICELLMFLISIVFVIKRL